MFSLRSLKLSLGIVALVAAVVLATGHHVIPVRAAAMTHNQALGPCSRSSCSSAWTIAPSDSPGSQSNRLLGVASVAPGDEWAVGVDDTNTLIEHWNGTKWALVSSPNAALASNALAGVAGTSSTDVWAVGNYVVNTYYYTYNLIEHWNGTAWSIVPSPNEGAPQFNALFAVAAVSANDAWAVGEYYNTTTYDPLIEHWNGSNWSIVSSPTPPNAGYPGDSLVSVTALSSTDVWAAGTYSTSGGGADTLTEHWDGTSWSIVSSPNPSTTTNMLTGVGGSSSNDMWAIGNYPTGQYSGHSLIEHWNGTTWSVAPNTDPPESRGWLNSVAVLDGKNVWFVGNFDDPNGIVQVLTEHWDGSNWSAIASPAGFAAGYSSWSTLTAAVVSSASTIDTVGYYMDSHGIYQTLAEHYNMLTPLGAPGGSGTGSPPGSKLPGPKAVCVGRARNAR